MPDPRAELPAGGWATSPHASTDLDHGAPASERIEAGVEVAVGTTGYPLLREVGHTRRDRMLSVQWRPATGKVPIASLTVTERGANGRELVTTIVLGPGCGGSLRVHGSVELLLGVSGPVGGEKGTFHYAIVPDASVEPCPPIDAVAGGLVQAVGGGAGAWSAVGTGWLPYRRTELYLMTLGVCELQFDDGNGSPLSGVFTVTGPHGIGPIFHPPRARLLARHPGASADTRSVLATWR